MNKTAKHPSGQEISFNEEHHRYESNQKILVSTTTLIKQFFTEFDKDGQAQKKANKTNTTKEEILKQWEETANNSVEHGKRIHAYIENKLQNLPVSIENLSENTIKCLDGIVEKIKDRYDIIEPEKIIFSPELGVSGTIDLFGKRKDTNEYVVIDWKTNKQLDMDNKYNQFGKDIFSHIPDQNFDHYSLQVNMYKEILIREGYIPKDSKVECLISHIPSSQDGVNKVHKAKDYSKEIKNLLKQLETKED